MMSEEERAAIEEAERLERERGEQVEQPKQPDHVNDGRTIYQRMVAIIDELPAIGKTQRNEQQNFMFRGHDDMLNALTPLLAKHGIIIVPRVLDRITSQRTTNQNKIMYEVNLHIEYTFYGAAGDSIFGSAWGEGTDMGDKSTMKAGTMAFKAMLNQAFAINTEEGQKHDADKTTPEDTVREAVRVDPQNKPPQTWSEALKRFDSMVGRDGEGSAWLEELVELRFAVPSLADLDSAGKKQAFVGFASPMMLLEERYGDLAFQPGLRAIIAAAFAEKNDGLHLDGPPWPIDAKEAEERGEPVGRSEQPAEDAAGLGEPPVKPEGEPEPVAEPEQASGAKSKAAAKA